MKYSKDHIVSLLWLSYLIIYRIKYHCSSFSVQCKFQFPYCSQLCEYIKFWGEFCAVYIDCSDACTAIQIHSILICNLTSHIYIARPVYQNIFVSYTAFTMLLSKNWTFLIQYEANHVTLRYQLCQFCLSITYFLGQSTVLDTHKEMSY